MANQAFPVAQPPIRNCGMRCVYVNSKSAWSRLDVSSLRACQRLDMSKIVYDVKKTRVKLDNHSVYKVRITPNDNKLFLPKINTMQL